MYSTVKNIKIKGPKTTKKKATYVSNIDFITQMNIKQYRAFVDIANLSIILEKIGFYNSKVLTNLHTNPLESYLNLYFQLQFNTFRVSSPTRYLSLNFSDSRQKKNSFTANSLHDTISVNQTPSPFTPHGFS